MNHSHDHDEDDSGPVVVNTLPVWRFSPWDMLGIAAYTASGVLSALGSGAGLLATEFAAAANYSRSKYDQREAERAHAEYQRAIGADIAALIGQPVEGDES